MKIEEITMIPVSEPWLGDKELEYVTDCINSGWISSIGKYVEMFEEKFSQYCDMRYGVSTSNGTTALHLALTALGIGKGDEVLVPDLTFIATANAVTYCNAKPVFVDSHPDYWCINPEKIEEKITKNTKAIIPVHLYGHPCDMDPIMDLARDHDMYIIEDVAEAHGAKYKGRVLGSFGDISCFSFYGNKIITTGEGGMCLMNDEELMERSKLLRDHAMSREKRYWHDLIGFNYRLTNIQAAIGIAQLEKIDKIIEIKRKNAQYYAEGLRELDNRGLITLHPQMPWAKNVYWMYSIIFKRLNGLSRDKLICRLKDEGIDTRPFFYPMHVLPPYVSNIKFPIAQSLSEHGINLPSSAKLTKETIDHISHSILELLI